VYRRCTGLAHRDTLLRDRNHSIRYVEGSPKSLFLLYLEKRSLVGETLKIGCQRRHDSCVRAKVSENKRTFYCIAKERMTEALRRIPDKKVGSENLFNSARLSRWNYYAPEIFLANLSFPDIHLPFANLHKTSQKTYETVST